MKKGSQTTSTDARCWMSLRPGYRRELAIRKRLNSAAPALLAACELALRVLEDAEASMNADLLDSPYQAYVVGTKSLRAAIIKAKGTR